MLKQKKVHPEETKRLNFLEFMKYTPPLTVKKVTQLMLHWVTKAQQCYWTQDQQCQWYLRITTRKI